MHCEPSTRKPALTGATNKTTNDFMVSFKSKGGGDVTIDQTRKETSSKGGVYELRRKTLLELESQYGALNASNNGKLEVLPIQSTFFRNILNVEEVTNN